MIGNEYFARNHIFDKGGFDNIVVARLKKTGVEKNWTIKSNIFALHFFR